MIWLLKFLHPLVLEYREGRLQVAKGGLRSSLRSEVELTLTQRKVARATLSRDGAGRWHFSSAIPVDLHQPLRNILNQD